MKKLETNNGKELNMERAKEPKSQSNHLPHPDWNISQKRISDIETFLENCEGTIYPKKENRYRALKMRPSEVRVVILGQDPYHDGSATGLAFDNDLKDYPHKKLSPSLLNIATEMRCNYPDNGLGLQSSKIQLSVLDHLPYQGVLLLNTALSVKAKSPGSHMKYWENFTSEVLQKLNALDDIIYLAWGKFAQDIIADNITNPTAIIIKTTHPSPFSANKASKEACAFIGSECFETANAALIARGKTPINW